MATARKPKKETDDFVAAVKYVLPAHAAKSDNDMHRHILMADNFASLTNGVITLGAPIAEPIEAAPDASMLYKALSAARTAPTIVQESFQAIRVQAGRLKALVPCVMPSDIIPPVPDEPVGVITADVIRGMGTVAVVAREADQRVALSAVWLRQNTVCATDGVLAMEFWHGVDMPPLGFVIPRASVNAIVSANALHPFTRFGFSERSITFHAESGHWLKTQLYLCDYPDIDRIFGQATHATYDVSEELKEAVEAVAQVSKDKRVTLTPVGVHANGGNVSHEVDKMPLQRYVTLDTDLLQKVLKYSVQWMPAEYDSHYPVFFFGPSFRAALAPMREAKPVEGNDSDDIPF